MSSGSPKSFRHSTLQNSITPKLHHSETPSLRSTEIEDEDDDENENEVLGEIRLTL